MTEIDGSWGEGGGQIVRSSLSLSMVCGEPIHLTSIRAGRKKPGLRRQHVTAVRAAAAISGAEVVGDEVGSEELLFHPGVVQPGSYRFSVGSAGSATLVFQTVLPALLVADEQASLVLEGGTHNPWSPPFDFIERAFLPLIERLGPGIRARLKRPGFFPAGGGRFTVDIEPSRELKRLELTDRGGERDRRAAVLLANLPSHIARRELGVIERGLGIEGQLADVGAAVGPGNAVVVDVECEHVTEVFTGFGQRGVRAEKVAERVVAEVKRYLSTEAAVSVHLADQLLLPLALGGGGSFTTLRPSLHTTTNIHVIQRFLDVPVSVEPADDGVFLVTVG